MSTFILKSTQPQLIISEFLGPLSQLIINYNQNVPDARDPEVLFLFAAIIQTLGQSITSYIPDIIKNLFESTLGMIDQNFQDYTDFRRGFFTLCKNIVFYSVEGLYTSEEQLFQIFINSIIWAFKHDQPELAELGLSAMSELITQVSFKFEVCNPFFKTYFMPILQDTFFVLTDGTHKGGFQLQIEILKKLFSLVEENRFTEEIQPGMSNKAYILEYLSDALSRLFTNMNKVQIETAILNMFTRCNEKDKFIETIIDLLVSLKEFAETNDDFYNQQKQVRVLTFRLRCRRQVRRK